MPRTIAVEAVLDTSQLERGFARASWDASRFNRDINRTFRGVISGSGIFKSLGRQVVFASASFLGGAVFLVWADTLARTAFAPSELPVGVVTALLGGPFFLMLLRRSLKRGES